MSWSWRIRPPTRERRPRTPSTCEPRCGAICLYSSRNRAGAEKRIRGSSACAEKLIKFEWLRRPDALWRPPPTPMAPAIRQLFGIGASREVVVIQDKAAIEFEARILIVSLLHARSVRGFVLIGDENQLHPDVIFKDAMNGFAEQVATPPFRRLLKQRFSMITLWTHYRMHEAALRYSNHRVYANQLRCYDLIHTYPWQTGLDQTLSAFGGHRRRQRFILPRSSPSRVPKTIWRDECAIQLEGSLKKQFRSRAKIKDPELNRCRTKIFTLRFSRRCFCRYFSTLNGRSQCFRWHESELLIYWSDKHRIRFHADISSSSLSCWNELYPE